MKKKKIPMRKCIITNEMRPKKDMIRVVINKEGEIFADGTGKQQGRGAYVSKDVKSVEDAQKNVTFIELEQGDHYLSKAKNRMKALKAIDKFIKQYI